MALDAIGGRIRAAAALLDRDYVISGESVYGQLGSGWVLLSRQDVRVRIVNNREQWFVELGINSSARGVVRCAASVVSRLKTWVLCGGGGLGAAPPLLDDVPASPVSRRLAAKPTGARKSPTFLSVTRH
jgi:hypothetical protein